MKYGMLAMYVVWQYVFAGQCIEIHHEI
jgi:hypothetical protein